MAQKKKTVVTPRCANCGVKVRWFAGAKAWLHVRGNSHPAIGACFVPERACQATPKVEVVKCRSN